jgi:hypothetical protein
MSSLHLVLCRGAIALGLVLTGVCGSHVCVALSAHDAQLRRSDETLAAANVGRTPARLAREQASEGFPQRSDARVRGRKPARLLVLR